jgi:serine protease Do
MKLRLSLSILLALALTGAAAASSNLDLARRLNLAFVEVAEKVSPSVVVIVVTHQRDPEAVKAAEDFEDGSALREFWEELHPQYGQGSGIIIRKDGYILTNRHIVEGAEKIEVRLQNGRRFAATVRGVDRHSDVAVVKIEAKDLPVAKLADSDKTRVGEFAIAIGTPFNLDYSVTFGHVSAKGRGNVVPSFSRNAMMDQDFIQTDANINPGNSGGPLVNIEGEVIGINTLIRGLRLGIGFAIPSNIAREISDQIIATGRFARPMLGVIIHGVKEDRRFEELSKRVGDGVVVESIVTNGPAAQSELRRGDIITRVDGQPVGSAQELRNELRGKKIGQPVALKVFREDQQLTIRVSPGEFVEPEPAFATVPPARELITSDLGLRIHPLTDELADQFGITRAEGVVVMAVEEKSPAHERGLKPGDIITSVNDREIFSPAQLREQLKDASLEDGIRLKLIRKGESRTETLKATK